MRLKWTVFLASLCSLFSFVPSDDWQLKKFENGISVYTRNTENSKYKELKAVYQLKTSLSSVIALLNDVDSYPKWIYRCGSSKLLKQSSDQDLIRYQTVIAPWPVDNRDMIVEVHSRQDETTGIVYQKVTALPDYMKELPGHVRIREFKGLWTLTPLGNGVIEVKYELLVNPAGSIPAWVVNMAVVDGPYETSVHMQEWLRKEKYQQASFPFIKEP
jgi:ribosome-associated toxin RatA of RatAB toxin-antitoxin module